jgi:hypothetical protein
VHADMVDFDVAEAGIVDAAVVGTDIDDRLGAFVLHRADIQND